MTASSRYSVRKLDPAIDRDWDDLVSRSVNGTFLHSRHFLSYHDPTKFVDHSVAVYKGSQLIAILPAAVQEVDGKSWVVSHPGATYGGPVFESVPGVATTLAVLQTVEEYFRGLDYAGLVVKPTPFIFHAFPVEEIDFGLRFSGYEQYATELTSVVVLRNCQEAKDMTHFRAETRNQCRMGSKEGLEFGPCRDVSGCYQLLCENLSRHGIKPVHSESELCTLIDMFPKALQLYAVALGPIQIAAALVFRFGKVVFHTQYLAMNYAYRHLCPMNFLVWNLLCTAAEEGYPYFNFGISTEADGQRVNSGLFKFKEGFGAGSVMIRKFRKEFSAPCRAAS